MADHRIGPLTRAEQVNAELAAIIASLPPGAPEYDPLDGDMVPDDYLSEDEIAQRERRPVA